MIDVPNLDTIAFEELVEEGRGLIPRYAPQWTDHNLHDPGMTLLDLLAWFVDQQVYRIGFVSDAHLAAFAALLGVKRQAAVPARGLIWPRAGALASDQRIAARTRAHPIEQPDLAFSVSHDLHLTTAGIAWIDARRPGGTRRIRPDKASGAILLDPDTEALDIVFARPLAPDGAPASLGLAYATPLPDPGAVPVRVDYLGADGTWHRATTTWVRSADGPAGAAGVVLVAIPPEHSPVARLRLDLGAGLPRPMRPVRIALNVVPIVQIARLPALKIGEGAGWPDHELPFDLGGGTVPEAEPGFLPPVVRSTHGTEAAVKWDAVPDFSHSGPADLHYVLDQGRGAIAFGNGINGRLPARGDEIFRDALDVTLGALGNLAAVAAWGVTHVDIPDGKPFGRNLDPVSGGSDAWSREDLRAELRRHARLRAAMLTNEDLLRAADDLKGYGIERAEVLARYLPALPGREVPGARTLLLRAGQGVAANDAWLDAVDRALAPRRVLGERLSVVAVEEVKVDVEALLLVAAGSDQVRIRGDAEQYLRERLATVKRGDDQEIAPWPSGRPVTIAELETLLASVDGVLAVTDLRLARAGETPARVSLPLARTEVALAARVEILFKVEG